MRPVTDLQRKVAPFEVISDMTPAGDQPAAIAEISRRIQAGDVRHDPKGDGCPAWCDLWPICRVARA